MPNGDLDHENSEALIGLQTGDVEPLISLLQDVKRPLHAELRLWLAATLVGDLQTLWWMEFNRHPSNPGAGDLEIWWFRIKRHPGFPRGGDPELFVRQMQIGRHIHELWDRRIKITVAHNIAVEKFNCEIRTIQSAWGVYRDVYFRLREDDISVSEDLVELRPRKQQLEK